MEQRDFLRKQMLKKTREQINEKFAGKEIHIIKAVNLLTDLDSIINLMKENANEWNVRQPTGEAKKAFSSLEENTKKIEEEKMNLTKFIETEMSLEFPNFSVLATPIIGAKLLASAGSKKKLCFSPASTIQVLGAEKALFAHIKTHAKSPKHGHLFNHPLMQRLPRFKRGRVARIIAGKLAIALKQDYFEGENTSKETQKELENIVKKISEEPITPKKAQKEKEYEDAQKSEDMKKEFLKRQSPKDRHLFVPDKEMIERNEKRHKPRRGNDMKRIYKDSQVQETEQIGKRKGFESQRRFEQRQETSSDSQNASEESEVLPENYPRQIERPRFGNDRGRGFGRDRGPNRFRRNDGESRGFGGPRREGSYPKRNNYGPKRSFGSRPSYGIDSPYGERKSFGEGRSFGERKPFGDRKPYGERHAYGERSESGFSEDNRERGYRPARQGRFGKPKFGNKRFGNKPNRNRSFGKKY